LAVIQIAGSWRLLLNGERIGGFHEQAEAVNCAASLAKSSRADGVHVEVLVQDVCGEVSRLAQPR
jgi:hypothetical protein